MPKLKTKRGCGEAFSQKTANGLQTRSVPPSSAYPDEKAVSKRKRQLRREMHVSESDVKRIKQCVCPTPKVRR